MPVSEAPLVDCHFHVWRADLPLTDTAWHTPPGDATTEQFIKVMDDHGVTFGVIAAASLHGTYNDYVREALRKHRRLRATATVSTDADIYMLERMKADGFVGIRMVRSVMDTTPDLNTGEYRKLFRRVSDLDWHVHLVDKPDRFEHTLKAVEASGVKIVVDHLGKLDTPEGINGHAFKLLLAAIERGRTWVKLSGGFRFEPPDSARDYARAIIELTGGERCLWGSDWPFAAFEDKVTYQSTIDAFVDWVPDAAIRRKIDRTALKFYFA